MSLPLVSIIVTCYNRADMVCTALDSIWAQTYRPLELIIVDDGSKDNSMEVIEAWVEEHPDTSDFTTIAKTFPNGKLCVARNRGLELSHGELIQYVDDDDWLYPEAIEKKVALYQADPNLDVIVNQVDYFTSPTNKIGSSKITIADNLDQQLLHVLNPKHETLFSPTLMIRKDTLQSVGAWTPGLIFADDIDVVVRLAAANARFGLVDEPLSAYLMHQQHRQCNVVVKQLPEIFWPELFERLVEFCNQNERYDTEIAMAFAGQLKLYGLRELHSGHFQACLNCLESASSLTGNKNWRLNLPKCFGIQAVCLRLETWTYTTWQKAKQILRKYRQKGK